jgi:hypothetical protein
MAERNVIDAEPTADARPEIVADWTEAHKSWSSPPPEAWGGRRESWRACILVAHHARRFAELVALAGGRELAQLDDDEKEDLAGIFRRALSMRPPRPLVPCPHCRGRGADGPGCEGCVLGFVQHEGPGIPGRRNVIV